MYCFKPKGILFYDRYLDSLAYATSSDGLHFEDKERLITDPDTAITNVNIIRDGNRLLGVLYGAFPKLSAVENCDYYYIVGEYCLKGHVNAYFLQKKVTFTTDTGETWTLNHAIDEDTSVLNTTLAADGSARGILRVYDTDAKTLLLVQEITIRPGYLYTIVER